MARFSLRPSNLFRRKSSRQSTAETTSSLPSTPSRTHVRAESECQSSPTLPPVTPQVRKTSSLAKLKEKFAAQGTEVPEAVQEQRESVLDPDTLQAESDRPAEEAPSPLSDSQLGEPTPPTPRRSGSETLASERPVNTLNLSKSDLESREPSPAAVPDSATPAVEELRLDEDPLNIEELKEKSPVIQVQEPTPTAGILNEPLIHSLQLDAAEEAFGIPSPLEQEDNRSIRSNRSGRLGATSSRSVSPNTVAQPKRPSEPPRRQSLVDSANARIVKTLVTAPIKTSLPHSGETGSLPTSAYPTSATFDLLRDPSVQNMASMLQRKIWVKRPGASATLVQIREDDLVDDVRDMILRKYANSLGKTFDAPDMVLRISSRAEHNGPRSERLLGPEEEMCRTIDTYYPSGQSVEEALIIDVPQKRTPRPSPGRQLMSYQQHQQYQQNYAAMDEYRPMENGNDYFPPMPAVVQPSMPQTTASHESSRNHQLALAAPEHQRSMAILNTGQLPPLPSPGAAARRHKSHRPQYQRQHTSSPTIVQHPSHQVAALQAAQSRQGQPQLFQPEMQPNLTHRASVRPRMDSSASEQQQQQQIGMNGAPAPPPLPSPPAPEAQPTNKDSMPPTPSVPGIAPGPHPVGAHIKPSTRPKKGRKPTPEKGVSRTRRDLNSSPNPTANGGPAKTLTSSMLDASVPPIHVLIVEDNIINLRILEGLMKRLKVRWKTAMNGQIAVDEWRKGGFHLVLMDIQMPVMNGLQATKEIRRLERVNGIGVFSTTDSANTSPIDGKGKGKANGALTNGDAADGKVAKKEKGVDALEFKESTFKSPVIIVALTASSLQSDRHEALAAGCNDFLTKPVNFVWLERKVKEWGCMQALIDFDGWRKWKDYAAKEEEKKNVGKSAEEIQAEKEKEERQKKKMEKFAAFQEKQAAKRREDEAKKKELAMKRSSIDGKISEGSSIGTNGTIAEDS